MLKATDGAGVDLIVDQVSGGVANDNLRATKYEGRIVNVGRLGGMTGEFDFDLHALRRINYIGVTFRTRTIEEIRAITTAVKNDIWDAVVSGKLNLPIDKVFPFARGRRRLRAHDGQQAFRKDRAADVIVDAGRERRVILNPRIEYNACRRSRSC